MRVEKKIIYTAKKPPSRIKYEQQNPCFTIRMPKELYVDLTTFLQETGRDRRTFIEIALGKLKVNHERAYEQGTKKGYQDGFSMGKQDGNTLGRRQGFDEGYAKGKQDWAILVNCCTCKTPFYIYPNSKEHYKLKERMERYLFCKKCIT